MAEFPEVVDCWLMTGDRDYLLYQRRKFLTRGGFPFWA